MLYLKQLCRAAANHRGSNWIQNIGSLWPFCPAIQIAKLSLKVSFKVASSKSTKTQVTDVKRSIEIIEMKAALAAKKYKKTLISTTETN